MHKVQVITVSQGAHPAVGSWATRLVLQLSQEKLKAVEGK